MTKTRIITFDLDGTLIQSSQFYPLAEYDFLINRHWTDRYAAEGIRVKLRPGVKQLLQQLSAEYYLAVFSHSFPKYIKEVLDGASITVFFDALFSNHDEVNDAKDLNVVLKRFNFKQDVDLNKIIIIDDNQWCQQSENVLQVPAYCGTESDTLFSEGFSTSITNAFSSLLT